MLLSESKMPRLHSWLEPHHTVDASDLAEVILCSSTFSLNFRSTYLMTLREKYTQLPCLYQRHYYKQTQPVHVITRSQTQRSLMVENQRTKAVASTTPNSAPGPNAVRSFSSSLQPCAVASTAGSVGKQS